MSPYKRVLCICTANALRSPTMQWVLSNPPYNYNTRSCGLDHHYALIPLSRDLVNWAEEIVCADQEHVTLLQQRIENMHLGYHPTIHCLNIPDNYEYRDPQLVELIKERYDQLKSN